MGTSNNEVRLEGRITAGPELRYTQTGRPVANFSLAVRREYSDKGDADFLPIVAWNKTAEAIAQYVVKGQQLTVSGRMQSRTYETQDGQQRTVVEVVAREVKFAASRRRRSRRRSASPNLSLPQDRQSPGPSPRSRRTETGRIGDVRLIDLLLRKHKFAH